MKAFMFLILANALLFIFTGRLADHLRDKARMNNPFGKYESVKEFYLKEVIWGLFLKGRFGAFPWFMIKKTDDKNLHDLYKVINVLTVLHYLSLLILIVILSL